MVAGNSVPQLDSTIPTAGDDATGRVRQPSMTDDDFLVCSDPLEQPGRLPIPEDDVPLSITRTQESSIGGECHFTSIPRDCVSFEDFLTILTQRVRRVDQDGVI